MGKGPKLSLVIPVYNVRRYIGRCLESIIHQTLWDIEVLCIDDDSTDGSCEIIEKFMELDERIQLIHKSNGGVSSARNLGIQKATGEYIWFIDSDDYIEKWGCERLFSEILDEHPDVICFSARPFPDIPYPNEWLWRNLYTGTRRIEQKDSVKAVFTEEALQPFVWRNCYRREFLTKNNLLFEEDIPLGEDAVFQFKVFANKPELSMISDCLYCYRHFRADSAMKVYYKDINTKLEYHVQLVERIFAYWDQKGLFGDYKRELYKWSKRFVGNEIKHMKNLKKKQELHAQLSKIYGRYGV